MALRAGAGAVQLLCRLPLPPEAAKIERWRLEREKARGEDL
jgi:hypothetical protein